MVLGYVLVKADAGQEATVHKGLQQLPDILELVPLFGEYDFIAKVEAPDIEALGKTVLDAIRPLPGIMNTKTLTGARL